MRGKVLIFGIDGFVGRYMVNEFLDSGYIVYGSDRNKPINIHNGIDFRKADLLDIEGIQKIVSDVSPDIIVNLAAISSVGESWNVPQTTMMVNVVGAINIMEAVKSQGKNSKIMLIGSSEEYVISNSPIKEENELDSNNPYGISKVAQESFAKLYREQYDMRIYCVRSFNHTGVGQKESFVLPSFCKQVADITKSGRSGTMQVGNLAIKRDFSHVKDVVHAYRMIIESDNYETVYNVGSGKVYELGELLNYIVGLSDQDITIETDKSRFRPTDQPMICCDNSLIVKELGWKMEYTVFDALKEMFESFC